MGKHISHSMSHLKQGIWDVGSCTNVTSNTLVNKLNLSCIKHPSHLFLVKRRSLNKYCLRFILGSTLMKLCVM
jgi:hypothetical protein